MCRVRSYVVEVIQNLWLGQAYRQQSLMDGGGNLGGGGVFLGDEALHDTRNTHRIANTLLAMECYALLAVERHTRKDVHA